MLQMRNIDECAMEKFGILLITDSKKTIAILADRWWPQTAKQEGDKVRKSQYLVCNNGKT